MADIGKPVKRQVVIPLTKPINAPEPVQKPIPVKTPAKEPA